MTSISFGVCFIKHCKSLSIMPMCNKKFELMFMKRAIAYSSSCSHVILVCLYPLGRNSFFCSRKSKQITKNLFLGFKVI